VEPDEALMRRFQAGDEAAYETLVRRWEDRLLTFFHRALGDADAAEDLRQELFIRLYLRGASYRADGSVLAWVYAIANNLIRSHYRKAKWNGSRRETEGGEDADPIEGAVSPAPGSREVAQRNERARLVRGLLAALPERDREVLLLRYFGGLRFGEIARTIGIGEPAAKLRAIRAVERLRRLAVERGLTARELL